MAAAEPMLAERIDALLPQTQCTKCGYSGCLPYAEAIASGEAEINQCPPGGAAGIEQLARLLGRPVLPLNPAHGQERPLRVARIDAGRCIGCTLCIQACPVDAIAGSVRRLHAVIESQCTGCDLCVPPCPTDCIAMVPLAAPRSWTPADAADARRRLHARTARLARERSENEARLAVRAEAKLDELAARSDLSADERVAKQAVVRAAIERARARRRTAASAPATGPSR